MREMTEQVLVERAIEEADKDKKRRRRRSRSNKHNSSSSGVICNGTNGEAIEWVEHVTMSNNGSMPMQSDLSQNGTFNYHALSEQGLSRASDVGFSSLPMVNNGSDFSQDCTLNNHALSEKELSRASDVVFGSLPQMYIREEEADLGSMHQCEPYNNTFNEAFSKSCPEPICSETNRSSPSNGHPLSHKNKTDADMKRNYFVPYWSTDTVNEAMQKGEIFKASFRVNAHNRLEAYCTVDGMPIDVLINGVHAQNRAVEGDIVVIKLDTLALWARMKGSAGHGNNCIPLEVSTLPKVAGVLVDKYKGKENLDDHSEPNNNTLSSDHSNFSHNISEPMRRICALISSYPTRRPTGTVVAVIQKSPRRHAVVGFLGVSQWLSYRERFGKETKKKKNFNTNSDMDYIQLIPNDAKFPKMLVSFGHLPDSIKKRLVEGDAELGMELVAARIDDWREDNLMPYAHVMHSFGRGGDIEPQVAAILYEHAISITEFSPESLACLPETPWKVPLEELERRKDLRNLCTFTVDPSTATDLDDALSVERVSSGIFRVGVHIADVSHFVLPDTPLDKEAKTRATNVYIRQHRLQMLPSVLSEDIGSLSPGLDRLTFSVIFYCNLAGDVVDRWIGRTVIHSCCKLSYQNVQHIIDGVVNAETQNNVSSQFPELYGQFVWEDVIGSVKSLYEISKRLRERRFKDGAIHLENAKPFFLLDECGIPYDSVLSEQKDSEHLVEEFMLLTNRTAAEIISRAYPECALLRRHPEPNGRKLKEFEAFCHKHGLQLDTSSSSQFSFSLGKIREKLNNDPVFFDILISFASKPMQAATYFCTGNFKDRENEWAHYALAMPLYTHFTSPLRRYADILVHRTLSAAVEAEELYFQQQNMMPRANMGEELKIKCFTGLHFDVHIVESNGCREALAAAALKNRVPCMEVVGEVAAYCNEKKSSSRHAEDAGEKLYMWALLKNKETLIAEARVLGLGPKFMSIYIHKLAIERRIHYDEVESLTVEWLENTSTLVLSLCSTKRNPRRGNHFRPLEDVALILNPLDLEEEQSVPENSTLYVDEPDISSINEVEPAVFPLTVRILSTIHVALHAVGGDDGPLDIGARLYMSSYLR